MNTATTINGVSEIGGIDSYAGFQCSAPAQVFLANQHSAGKQEEGVNDKEKQGKQQQQRQQQEHEQHGSNNGKSDEKNTREEREATKNFADAAKEYVVGRVELHRRNHKEMISLLCRKARRPSANLVDAVVGRLSENFMRIGRS